MHEHRHRKPISSGALALRVVRRIGLAMPLMIFSLGAGMWGYRATEGMSWVDAFVNAAMLLGGMGPVNALHSTAGKIFAGTYALYSGLVFLIATGIILAPFLHHVLHIFHWETDASPE